MATPIHLLRRCLGHLTRELVMHGAAPAQAPRRHGGSWGPIPGLCVPFLIVSWVHRQCLEAAEAVNAGAWPRWLSVINAHHHPFHRALPTLFSGSFITRRERALSFLQPAINIPCTRTWYLALSHSLVRTLLGLCTARTARALLYSYYSSLQGVSGGEDMWATGLFAECPLSAPVFLHNKLPMLSRG